MAFTPIANERLSDKVVQVIMDQINDGVLKPGDKLPNELELAEELGVSRGILREALTILQARNLICRKQKEGTFVNPDVLDILNSQGGISLKEATYFDMLEMRECIEQRVVEKVIDSASDKQIAELTELLGSNWDTKKTNTIDYYFHYRLAELSQNAMFVNFIDTYYDVIDELAKTTTKKVSRKDEINQEHMEIITAILERDKSKAKKAVVQHLSRVKEHIKSAE